MENTYRAYTLLEMLLVMAIIGILAGMSFSSFGGLQNTVKMNEYLLTLEQDIRSAQRASMLLERDPNEKWIYGIGIDLTEMNSNKGSGTYKVFKWCSPYDTYGDVKTTSLFPNYNPNDGSLGTLVNNEYNGYLPIPTNDRYLENTCDPNASVSELRTMTGYDVSTQTPESNITVKVGNVTAGYILFESVSGKTFFYGLNGELLDYNVDGTLIDEPQNLEIRIDPISASAKTHTFEVSNLSGKITTYVE